MSFIFKSALLFVLMIVSFLRLHSRPAVGELLKMSENERLVVLSDLRLNVLNEIKGDKEVLTYLDSLILITEKDSNKEIYLEALLFKVDIDNWLIHFERNNYEEIISLARRLSLPRTEIRANMFLAEYYWSKAKEYEKGLEVLMKIKDLVSSIENKDYFENVNYWYEVGSKYYYFLDYPKAIQVLKEVINKKENFVNARAYNSSINTLGLCYQELKQFDSANHYFNVLKNKEYRYGATDWRDIAIGNLGFSYYFQKDYEKSFPLLLWDFETSIKRNDPYCASGSSIALADIYLQRNEMDKALTQIELSRKYIAEGKKFERYAFLYPIIANWYLKKHNPEKAEEYMDSSVVAINNYHKERSTIQLYRVMQRIDVMERATTMLQIEAKQLKAKNKRNLIIFILTLLVFVSLALYFLQKRKSKLRLKEKDLHIKKAELELMNAQKQLESFTRNLLEKNKLIESLQSKDQEDNLEIVQELFNSVILTEDDWEKFQSLFEEAHPKIQTKLNNSFPNLTISEYRYLMLSYLNFSHKDMASVLGISSDSLRVTWFRIRKKLNLQPEITVQEVLAKLDNNG